MFSNALGRKIMHSIFMWSDSYCVWVSGTQLMCVITLVSSYLHLLYNVPTYICIIKALCIRISNSPATPINPGMPLTTERSFTGDQKRKAVTKSNIKYSGQNSPSTRSTLPLLKNNGKRKKGV